MYPLYREVENFSIFVSIHPTLSSHLETSRKFRLWEPQHRRATAGGRDKCYSPLLFFFLALSLSSRTDDRARTHARAKRDAERNPYIFSLSFSSIPSTQSTCARWQPAARESRKGKSRCEKSASILRALRARERKQKRKEHAETIRRKYPTPPFSLIARVERDGKSKSGERASRCAAADLLQMRPATRATSSSPLPARIARASTTRVTGR